MLKNLRFILLSLSLLVALNGEGRSMYALIIGIGEYPENSGWDAIHGNNDVPLINSCLLRQGFLEENIMKLIDADATKRNIIDAFDKLSNRVQGGDVVYIHFSGHGQQVADLNGDEEDGFDEAWIPYDAKKSYEEGIYEGENHLIDDELNALLTDLRSHIGAYGKIIVVADACHSGSGSRGLSDDEYIRGTRDAFIIPEGKESDNQLKSKTGEWSKPEDWLFIAACEPDQSNYEYKTEEGEFFGKLSYVISIDTRSFDKCDYSFLVDDWAKQVSEKSKRHHQNVISDGEPNQKDQYMF